MDTTIDDYVEEAELAAPWPRFFARYFDLQFYVLTVGFVLGFVFPSVFIHPIFESRLGDFLATIICLPIAMLLDALIISATGASPGKWIAGFRVLDSQGQRLSTEVAIRRNLLAYVKGFMFGIPIVILIGYANAYNDVKNHGYTSWDDATGSRVYVHGNNVLRTAIVAVLALCLIIAARSLLG